MRSSLRVARLARKMTQAQVAEMARIDRASYTHIERGTRNPSMEVAQSIARVLGQTVDELFFDEDVSQRDNDDLSAAQHIA
ncbi:MAG: helix-turn-helix transcriptional regulator [Clostridiales bacterium]|nr:helix-turn-helix transcriptional regulator [Clostridiales bacterium]